MSVQDDQMANPDVVANTTGERPDHRNEAVVSHYFQPSSFSFSTVNSMGFLEVLFFTFFF